MTSSPLALAALTAQPGLPEAAAAANPSAATPGDAAQTADFGAVLAITTLPAAVPATPGPDAASAFPSIGAAPQLPAILQPGGKPLPVALPVTDMTAEPRLASVKLPFAPGRVQPAADRGAEVPTHDPAAADDAAEPPADDFQPIGKDAILPAAMPPIPTTAIAPTAISVETAAAPAPADAPRPSRVTLAMPLPQPASLAVPAPLAPPQAQPDVQTPSERSVPPAPISVPAQVEPAAPAEATLRISLTAHGERSFKAGEPMPIIAAQEDPAAAPFLAAPPLPASPGVAAPAIASPAAQPLDFAALVDRIAAAREAVQPQAVSIALSHRDFGPVRLHFRPEEGALSVTVASPDPDFARAVAAAPPIQPVASVAESAAPRPQGSDTRTADSGSGHQRGQPPPERRDERRLRDAAPLPRPGQGSDRSSAIFA